MPLTRRHLLANTASIASLVALDHLGLAQAATQATAPAPQRAFPPPPVDNTPPKPPSTRAAKALYAAVGASAYDQVQTRMRIVNLDVVAHGLRHIPNVDGTFLTGYPYNEFYDWDLYFENLYLSYFGVAPYCFTNLKEFLNREQPDGYVNRSLIKQRDRQQFKPFLAQLAVLGSRQTNNSFEWLRGNYYDRLNKYLVKWFSYDGDHTGRPTPPERTTSGRAAAESGRQSGRSRGALRGVRARRARRERQCWREDGGESAAWSGASFRGGNVFA